MDTCPWQRNQAQVLRVGKVDRFGNFKASDWSVIINHALLLVETNNPFTHECRAHTSFCTHDKVTFLSPKHMQATLLPDARVKLTWQESTSGWRAPERILTVREALWNLKIISENKLESENSSIIVDGVELDKSYQIIFYPRGPNISPHIGHSVLRKITLSRINFYHITRFTTWSNIIN